jgi:hypothetical protein
MWNHKTAPIALLEPEAASITAVRRFKVLDWEQTDA